jgi:GT2 family glycosyltransferase
MLVLQIDYQNTASPVSAGLDAGDKRELAVFFRSLRLEYPVGELAVDFSTSGNLGAAALFGFWRTEAEGTWSAGARSALAFDLPPPRGRELRLTLEAHCFEQAFPVCNIKVATSSGQRGEAVIGGFGKIEMILKKPLFCSDSRLVTGDMHAVAQCRNVSSRKKVPRVSLILLNRDKPLMTRVAAMAAASSKPSVPFEILCVDNGSSAENLAILQKAEVEMRFLEFPENKGFGVANNLAASQARGEFLLFLNNDAFLRPGAIREMLQAFQNMPDCGAVGAVLRYPDGQIQEAGCTLRDDGTAIRHGRDDPAFSPARLPVFHKVDYVSGACLLIRRQEFLEIGGFDPIYSPAYYEDTDLCMRLREKGKRVYLASKTSCYHIENATSRDIEDGAWATRTSEAHRAIFLQDWAPYLASRHPADFPKL